MGAAGHRAAHQILERGAIYRDPLAVAILGEEAQRFIAQASGDPSSRRLRIFIAARSRLAHEAVSAAVARGVRQVVILGAGLDTWAYRRAPGEGVRIFEVDHPATQAWKRARLAAAAIPVPPALIFVPIDFEHESLADCLRAATFDTAQESFFSWLGVVPYLHEPTVLATLGFISALSGGAQVVFDYGNPPESMPPGRRAAHDALAERVAAAGEHFRSYFETGRLHATLRALGFMEIEDLDPAQIAARYLDERVSETGSRGGHLVRAATKPATRPAAAP